MNNLIMELYNRIESAKSEGSFNDVARAQATFSAEVARVDIEFQALRAGKYRQALSQEMHAKHNAQNYPGTRQLCMHCDQPTERCEEDSLDSIDGEPLCPDCYEKEKANEPTR